MNYANQKIRVDYLETKKVKLTCNAGFSRIMEITSNNKLKNIKDFPAFNNVHLDSGFLPECTNCNDTRVFLSFNNENDDTQVVKICNFTLEDEP